jgi:hypothetical protein
MLSPVLFVPVEYPESLVLLDCFLDGVLTSLLAVMELAEDCDLLLLVLGRVGVRDNASSSESVSHVACCGRGPIVNPSTTRAPTLVEE